MVYQPLIHLGPVLPVVDLAETVRALGPDPPRVVRPAVGDPAGVVRLQVRGAVQVNTAPQGASQAFLTGRPRPMILRAWYPCCSVSSSRPRRRRRTSCGRPRPT